jgi:alpha-galactosidase
MQACAKLTDFYGKRLTPPASEEDLPVIFNDYCCTWGYPSMEKLRPLIDECARLGVGYFVVDVGWWRQDERSWYTFGDWDPGRELFPEGISELADYVKKKGMKAGIWFEFEGVSQDSKLFAEHPEYLLKKDGYPIRMNDRAFLDFRRADVREFLYNKVIRLLKDNGFEYVKIDCNESIGMGADGAESYGEALREHMSYVTGFFRRMRTEIPGLVMEVCSSGGMRLEPKFLSLASMASFSDAHLGPEGAAIAIDLHRYMHPKQMQIWATLKSEYSLDRIYFTIAKGMLGRYCVSGEITTLSGKKKQALVSSVPFYEKLKHIIKSGETVSIKSSGVNSLRRIKGEQYLLRLSQDGESGALYYFSYAQNKRRMIMTEDIFKIYEISEAFARGSVRQDGKTIRASLGQNEYAGGVILLKKRSGHDQA